jgi:hypothetical protein
VSEGTCDVSIGDYDGDPAEVFHASVVTARKRHKCDECGEPIEPRQRYERSSGKWDGVWSVWRLCLPCRDISAEFSDNGRVFGELWPEMERNWDEGAHLQACLNRLTTVAAKERLRHQWMKWKGLP